MIILYVAVVALLCYAIGRLHEQILQGRITDDDPQIDAPPPVKYVWRYPDLPRGRDK